jgi:two-component system sensor histidine kinase MprB
VSLRARVALLVAGVVTVIVAVVGVMSVRAASTELHEEIDDDLLQRAAEISRSEDIRSRAPVLGAERRRVPPRDDLFRLFVAFDAQARVLSPAGDPVLTLDQSFDAPTDADFLDEVSKLGPQLVTVDGDSESFRVVTVEAPGGLFVQLARSLDEVDDAVRGLRQRVLLLGALAIGGAALGAWFLAHGAVRPIEKLTATAEHVAATGELDAPIDGSGPTEVGSLATSFRTMLEALAISRRQQHELVMNASHELRTPLTSMRTNVDLLRRRDELPLEDHEAMIDDIDAELGELTDLVGELVDLATEVRDNEEIQPLFLGDIVETVMDRERRRTGRDIELRVGRRSLVEGRPEALSRAVRNLVANAAKFTDDGPVEIVVDGGRVTVHDAGPGIPPEERERVFERFHRLESARSKSGSGLGLAIVAQVAEAHSGSVFAGESALGGAAVGFEVPTVDD